MQRLPPTAHACHPLSFKCTPIRYDSWGPLATLPLPQHAHIQPLFSNDRPSSATRVWSLQQQKGPRYASPTPVHPHRPPPSSIGTLIWHSSSRAPCRASPPSSYPRRPKPSKSALIWCEFRRCSCHASPPLACPRPPNRLKPHPFGATPGPSLPRLHSTSEPTSTQGSTSDRHSAVSGYR